MDHSTRLGKKNIIPLLLEFSIPSIIGMFVNAIYNIVDRIYVGHGVGTTGISALAIVFPIQLIVFAFAMLVALGTSALISIALGEKNKEKAEHLVGNGFTLMVIVGIITPIIGLIFIRQILLIAGSTKDTFDYAMSYFKIIFYFTIFQFIGYGLNSFIRSEGNPLRSMLSMIAGAVTNIILDPIFIFVFKMGVKGAAIATGISFIVTAIWNFYYFTKGKSIIKLKFKYLFPDLGLSFSIIKIGISPFFMQIVGSTLSIILNIQIKNYGFELTTLSQAAIGVVQGFNMLFFMPLLGINMGAQPIIGYNYGAKKFDRVKKTLLYSIFGGAFLTTLCFLLSEIFPSFIFNLFNNNDLELLKYGSRIMRIIMISFPIVGVYVISSNYYQAIGKPKQALFLGIARPVFFLIPFALILPIFFGLDGIWFSIPLADIGSTLLTLLFIISEFRNLHKKHLKEKNDFSNVILSEGDYL